MFASVWVFHSIFMLHSIFSVLCLSSESDFTTESITVTVPANSESFTISEVIPTVDDDLDEDTQSFAVVVEIGQDIPEGISCFQTGIGESECHGRKGATVIRIVDNDRKI